MSNIQFPENPDNGMIFEASPGLFYQYTKPSKTWTRLDGLENISPATISEPGLMTIDDFKKVEGLLLPPLSTTISAQDCGTTFNNGKLDIISSEKHLDIDVKLDLFKGKKADSKVDFIIHENTFGIDFRINVQRLLEELTARGKLVFRSTPGPIGDPGDRGEPGINNLETGPQGEAGANGKNAPYSGILVEDVGDVKINGSRAVVDIKNDETDPSVLVVTVGNIGNPNSCPNRANIVDKNSPWMLVTSDKAPVICPVSVGCRICDTQLYYLDISDILSEIENQYEVVIGAIKSAKEDLVRTWLNRLIEMFNEQKTALCCAIEALASKQKNQDIRNIMSGGRAAAAAGGYAFAVSSSPNSPEDLIPRSIPQCKPESIYPPPRSTDPSGDVIVNGAGCETCYAQVTLRAGNVGESRALTFTLPAGSYVATLMQCCLNFNDYGSTGVYNVKFIGEVLDNGNLTMATYKTIDRGTAPRETSDQLYVGDSLSFTQAAEGQVSIWADSHISSSIDGEIIICIQPTSCFDNCAAAPSMAAAKMVDPTCSMAASHLEFYERGWRIGECCGAYVNVHGTGFLVVYRSVGIDMSCGGGESLTTPCIAKFKDMLGKQVAIAWPTIDGETFFGLPRDNMSTVDMVYDKDLSQAIVDAISAEAFYKKVGEPEKSITDVIVPIVL